MVSFCSVVNAKSNQAQWKHPDLLSCPTLLSTIPSLNNITVTANNSQDLAELIKNMTSNQGISSHEDLIIVVFKLLEIVKIGILTPPLGQTIIDIINNILETNIDLQPVTNDILEVTDTLGNKLIFDGMSLNVSSPMLALSILNVDPTDFNGMAFGVSSFSEGINPEVPLHKQN
ncbi:adhesion G-protein coupled receptor G6-like [Amia ocellicauda]|uniref:adhesion G-protein coupled receptor G6-like n=1 Tax=Amia ocellicauda TaxID=2972642 RepID=UPI003464A234